MANDWDDLPGFRAGPYPEPYTQYSGVERRSAPERTDGSFGQLMSLRSGKFEPLDLYSLGQPPTVSPYRLREAQRKLLPWFGPQDRWTQGSRLLEYAFDPSFGGGGLEFLRRKPSSWDLIFELPPDPF